MVNVKLSSIDEKNQINIKLKRRPKRNRKAPDVMRSHNYTDTYRYSEMESKDMIIT